MRTLKINILRDDEFDALGPDATRGADISDSLGFANKYTGNAYVRYTGVQELNKYLIDHEVEELLTDHSAHEDEHGIRHKKFFKSLFGGGGDIPSAPPLPEPPPTPTLGPLGQFSVEGQSGSPRVGSVGQGPASTLTQQGGGLTPEQLERLKGFVGGRAPSLENF